MRIIGVVMFLLELGICTRLHTVINLIHDTAFPADNPLISLVISKVRVIKNVFKDKEVNCDVDAKTCLSNIKADFMVVKE